MTILSWSGPRRNGPGFSKPLHVFLSDIQLRTVHVCRAARKVKSRQALDPRLRRHKLTPKEFDRKAILYELRSVKKAIVDQL